MKLWQWLLLFAGLGLLLTALWQSGLWPNLILQLRMDVGSVIFSASLAVCAIGVVSWIAWKRGQVRGKRHMDQLYRELNDSHHRFLRRLDHELKNRTTGIRAAMVNLTDQPNNPALSGVRVEVDSLTRLGIDLRKLADLETQPIEQESIDLAQLLTELAEMAQQRPEAAAYHIKLVVPHVPWPLSPVNGDRDLIFLALDNLIDNALKFSRAGDTIEIRAFEDGPSVAVEVADTGPGIDPEDIPHIGEELYRGRTTRSITGSGLGLALVHAIVERHRGQMTVRSRLGSGTVVALRFPSAR